jgi:hypothetical protein
MKMVLFFLVDDNHVFAVNDRVFKRSHFQSITLMTLITMISVQLMITVGSPRTAIAPQMQASVVRSAGLPPMSTVGLPEGNTLAVG